MLKNRNNILGMNARSYIYLRVNKKKGRKIVDDKLITKSILAAKGLPVADLIAVLRERKEVYEFNWDSLPNSFVIKPARGFGGEGIIIVFNRLKNGNWLSTNKRQLTAEDLRVHVLNILDGNYSLLHTPDAALFESRFSIDPLFKRFSTFGIPDIRVIVYHNVPVMAMLRLGTEKSHGTANLAQGGLGVGIDLTTGLTTHVVVKSWLSEKEIERHPDTNAQLRGIKVPYWDEILKTAVLAAHIIGLQYAGVDISVDKKRGPVILELNARPGLGIQVANMAPLRERLQRVRGLKVDFPERGIAIAKDLFAGQFDAEVTGITGRKVLGLIEPITVYNKEKEPKKIKAKIDTGARTSSIDESLARALGFGEAIDLFQKLHVPEYSEREEAEEQLEKLKPQLLQTHPDIVNLSVVSSAHGISIRMHIKISIVLGGRLMTISPNVYERSHLAYPVLIGVADLTNYLIDPTKTPPKKYVLKKKKIAKKI
ncbi:MAG: hypothetical protein A2233_01080 [Candidatus Kerfeldbacteria bacterium RIFOXYA2_FULL_38_24]|uniref:ATP-grasp domain-containing protein n=1 Tax=Candidatus Kerfeldbacteria bacterium RIFOXYB2_FULL_38_14 TaxID=1798547 RepID=A0A1G2BE56_9BACT|nr:MAG: hypothetical protein A2233_01080 [Candidatus Kerfeldbacteria bacterium RIFOXYA2_FULL_38_24]OGY86530.1 MAG: hypothetical protein A2319_02070 [Candidatus Kerfeldbacteria bacterium RIFOXYB2_FULL_38_14]